MGSASPASAHLEYALLGFLRDQPAHGYALQAVLGPGRPSQSTAHRLIDAQRTACRTWLAALDDQPPPSTDSNGWLVYEFHRTHIAALLAWLDTCTATLAQAPHPS